MKYLKLSVVGSVTLCFGLVLGCSTTPDPAKRPHVPEGKALLITYDPGSMMLAGEWHVELNGRDYRHYGGMDGNEYFIFELWPGRHTGYLKRAGRADYFELEIEPWETGKIFLWRAFDNITRASEVRWSTHGGEVQGMQLLKRVGAREASPRITISTNHGKARYYGPTNSRRQPIMSGILEWHGNRYKPMEVEFHDANTDSGETPLTRYTSSSYRPAAHGVLEYRDGHKFVGDVLADETDGVLYDPNGNIEYSGSFRDGKPHGWGYARSSDSGEPESVYYTNGYLANDPVYAAAVNSVEQRLSRPSNEPTRQERISQRRADRAREQVSKTRDNYRRMSGRCSSTPLVWTVDRSDETPAERRLRERRKEQKKRACREWREGGITSKEELDAKLDSLWDDYHRAKDELRERRAARQQAHERETAEYQRRLQRELQAEQARIAREREQAKAEKKQECLEKSNESLTCDCAPFVEPSANGSPRTCGR